MEYACLNTMPSTRLSIGWVEITQLEPQENQGP
jgi:hypothetical protein